MQGLAYTPAKKASAEDFIGGCSKLLADHRVTLKLPAVILEDYYEEFTQRLGSALLATVPLEKGTHKTVKAVMRALAANAKETALRCIKVQAGRVLRRLLASHISSFYPACFDALKGLPVTLTVFNAVKVSFKLHFSEQYHKRRTLYANDFRHVIQSISWL